MNRLFSLKTTPELGKWYDNKYTEMGGAWNTPIEDSQKHLNKIIPFTPTGRVLKLLDLGCGGGHFLEAAQEQFDCSGIEISEVGLEEAKKRLTGMGVVLQKMDIENMTYPENYFDIITSIGTLEHVIDIPKAVAEAFRVLKEGGVFYVYAPNEKWIHEDQPNEIRMERAEWEKILDEAGFTCEYFEEVNDNNIYIAIKPFDQ